MGAIWPPALIAIAGVAAYAGSLSGPFIMDDVPSIVSNPTLRHLGTAFLPPVASTEGGRPVLNLSLAINYAISGKAVWSYHASNLAIHILAGLTLFGIARRTIERRSVPAARQLAFLIALLWTLHPLQTESVTYIIQRAESLMGLLYLLTVYCFVRGAESDRPRAWPWFALSLGACILGMGTKEVMASAPLVVLLYDRTFLAGSFRDALRHRWPVYAGLASTWVVLSLLVLSTHGRGGSAGLASGVSCWDYARTQAPAIVHYLRLCLWPSPLVFDYGTALAPHSNWSLLCAAAVVALVAASAWALFKKPVLGFLGASFFAILAPSSSFVPVATQTMAEHRMYLPLALVVALAVLAVARCLGRAVLPLGLAAAAALLCVTWQRNEVYRSEETIWGDTAAKRPDNDRALTNLGSALMGPPGRLNGAKARFEQALRLNPRNVEAHNDLGLCLSDLGRTGEAIAQFEEALRLNPSAAEAHNNLGGCLAKTPGRLDEAIAHFREALRINPGFADAHTNLGNALNARGDAAGAIPQFEEALELAPDSAKAHYDFGLALEALAGRLDEASAQFREAIRLQPDYTEAQVHLGNALLAGGHIDEAVEQYGQALSANPGNAEAHNDLGNALKGIPGKLDEAIAQYEQALRINPDYAEAHNNLGNALNGRNQIAEAVSQYEQALRIKPDVAGFHLNLAVTLMRLPGRGDEAAAHLREVLRLDPGNVLAQRMLAEVQESGR